MVSIVDSAFSHAVHAAAKGDPADLVEWLRSDMPLGAGEREMLASLVAGDFVKREGRPPSSNWIEQKAAVGKYRETLKSGITRKYALYAVGAEYNISRSTLMKWIKEIKEIEKQMNNRKLPNWLFEEWGSP